MHKKTILWQNKVLPGVMLWGVMFCWLVVGSVMGCTTNTLPTTDSSLMTSMIVIRQTDAGQTFTAHPGDIIEVLLDENPSTGYRWEVADLDLTVLVLLESSFFYSGEAIPGSGGVRRFQLEVTTPGESTVLFQLRRPWEEEVAPIEQFQVTIQAIDR